MFKKIIKAVRIICCLSIIFVCGCQTGENYSEEKKLSVITTIFPPYDFVRQIGGDAVSVKMLLNPGADIHSYEPSPKDIIDISECDLFIYTGGENDEWVDSFLDGEQKTNALKLIDCVELLDEEIKEGMSGFEDENHGHSHNHDHSESDDHVWTSPKNTVKIAKKICGLLCRTDPLNKNTYIKNTDNYISELMKLDSEFSEIINNSNRKTLIFGDRFPVRYFVEEYGLDYYAAFPGCSSSVEANPKTVEFLIEKIKEEDIPVIFYIELSDKRMANILAEETGARIMLFNSAHNISAEDFEKGITYIDIMKNNETALKEALS